MLTGTRQLLTIEEFARLPRPADGSKQELVKGVVVTVPPPSFFHGYICNRIGRKVGNHVDERDLGFVTNNDSGVIIGRDPATVRGPDIAFWSKARLPVFPMTGYPGEVPDLAIEVLSPGDVYRVMFTKVNEYLRSGVRMVWVIIPEDRSVGVFTGPTKQILLGEADTLDGGGVLPGFSCRVADLFPG